MNVKSITDLDDILINETDTYNDDDFDDESPPPKPKVSSQSKKENAEYEDDGFEADSDVHSLEEREEIWEDEIAPQVAPPTPTPIAANVVTTVSVPPSEIVSVPSIANFTPATPEVMTLSSSRRAAETILEAGLAVHKDQKTAWPETQRSTVSSQVVLPEPAPPLFTHLRMTGQKGVDCHVSHVQLVNEEERDVLASTLHTKNNRQPTKSSSSEREDTLRALEEMLLVAAERVEKRVASEHMLSSRSVPVVGGWVVPQLPNAKDPLSFVGANMGIPDYDPDYDVAMEMAQRRMIQPSYQQTTLQSQPQGNHRGGPSLTTTTNTTNNNSSSSSSNPNVPSSSSSSPSSSNFLGGVTVIKNNNHNNDSEEFVRTTLAQEERQRREKETSSLPHHHTASFTGSTLDARNMAEKLIEDINDQKVSSELLRLGINRPQLQDQSALIYSTFLSDIMELCKSRAAAATSIEEIAMHRALATYFHEFFVPAHQIKKARARMVEVAVESSLKYIPVQKNYPTTTSLSDSHSTGVKGSRVTPTSSGGDRRGGFNDRGTKMPRTTAQRRNKDHKVTTMKSSSTAVESAYRTNINNTRGLILREERIGGQR